MKKMMKIRKLFFLAIVVLAILTGSTCKNNAALGSSVDVVPPSVSANKLGSGDIVPVKGSFSMSGVAKDDDGVASVKIKFVSRETGSTVKSYNASLDNAGMSKTNWYVSINNEQLKDGSGNLLYHDDAKLRKKYPLADGEYDVVISVTDNSNRTKSITKVYTIDNTAPVLIIDSPTSSAEPTAWQEGSADTFGSLLKINGQIGDANDVKKIKLIAYSSKSPDKKYEITKLLAGSRSVDLIFAKAEADTAASHNYKDNDYGKLLKLEGDTALSGDDANLKNNIISDFVVIDQAQNPSSGGTAGNENEFFYLMDDLRAVMNKYDYTAQSIYDYFSGKSSSLKPEMIELLKSKKIKCGKPDATATYTAPNTNSKVIIKLKPNKNSGYFLNNFKFCTLDDADDQKLYMGTSISISLTRNRDKTNIIDFSNFAETKTKTKLKAYLVKRAAFTDDDSFMDALNNPPSPMPTDKFIEIFDISKKTAFGDDDPNKANIKREGVGNASLNIKLGTSYVEGKYALLVLGNDFGENDYRPISGAGQVPKNESPNREWIIFNLAQLGNDIVFYPPVFNDYYNSSRKLSVDIRVLNAGDGDVYYKIDGAASETTNSGSLSHTAGTDKYTKEIAIPTLLGSGDHKIYFYCKNPVNNKLYQSTSSNAVKFTVDKDKPTIPAPPPNVDWQNAATYKITGTARDHHSGISLVEYKIGSGGTWLAAGGTDSDDSWTAYISPLAEGENTVYYRAKDNAGNISAEVQNTIKYEHKDPTINILEPLGRSITLKTGDTLKLKVQAQDQAGLSGIKELRYSTDSSTAFDSATAMTAGTGSDSDKYTASGISVSGAQSTYYIWAKDNAGNISQAAQVRVSVDSDLPTVEFVTPSDNAIVNKTITITGRAGDNNGLKTVKITDSDGNELKGINGNAAASELKFDENAGFNWSFTLDTTQYFTDGNEHNLKLKAVAEDTAGNTTEKELTLKVNQDTDRPKIAITNLSALSGEYLTSANILYGTIQDDDGIVEKLEISQDGVNWTNVPISSGGWTYTVTGVDGLKTLKFKVTEKDASSANFSTSNSDKLDRPQIYAESIKDDSTDGTDVSFTLDSKHPLFINAEFSRQSDFSGLEVFSNNKDFKNENIYLKIKAQDSAGIQSLIVKGLTASDITTTKQGSPSVGSEEVWQSAAVNLNSEGVKAVKIEITDNSGSKTVIDRTIIVDHSAPKVTVMYPASDKPQSGTIVISGSITDKPEAGSAGVKSSATKYVFVEKTAATPTINNIASTAWQDMTSSSVANWSFSCNLETLLAHPENYGTANTTTANYWDIPFYILTEDAVGNKAVEKFTLLYNPDGKKPVMQIFSPESNSTVGGSIQVAGIGTVGIGTPDDIGEVYIQFSKTSSFDSSNCDINSHNWWNGGNGLLVTGSDTSGGKQWRMAVNKGTAPSPLPTGELAHQYWSLESPSAEKWDLWFRVKGHNDTHNAWGEWTAPVKITVDKSSPTIGSEIPIKIAYTSPAEQKNYLPYMWIKDGAKLTGSLHDASGIKSLEISGDLENGGTFTLAQAKANNWIVEDTDHAPSGGSSSKNYKLQLPLTLSNLTQDAKNKSEFKVSVKITEDTTDELFTQKEFHFKFDKTPPVGDVGTKLYAAYGLFRANEISDSNLASKLGSDYAGKKLLIKDTTVSINGISGNTISFTPAITLPSGKTENTYEYILYEQNTLVSADGAANWNAYGVASDSGSGVESVEAWISVNGHSTTHVTSTLTSSTNRITRELGSQYCWSTNLDISSLSDGKGELHYIVKDESGNEYSKTVPVVVRNKYFKLTKVQLATKIGSAALITNNTTSPSESDPTATFTSSHNSFKNQSGSLTTENFAFKSLTDSKIKLEFDGANIGEGQIRYRLKKADGTVISTSANAYAQSAGHDGFVDLTITSNKAEIPLTQELLVALHNSPANGTTKIKLELWDSAHGLTVGDTTEEGTTYADIDITTIFDANDEKAPALVILPFHWNSDADNSLYQNSKDNGHIEIANIAGYTGSSLSGKVRISGFVYDNIKVDTITAAVPNTTGLTVTASRSGSTWTSDKNMSSDGAELTVEEISLDYTGAYLKWTLDWNTENATVGKAKNIIITASDGTNPCAADTSLSSTEIATAIVTRTNKKTAEDAIFADAKCGQFVSFAKGEELYQTRIIKLNGNKATLENEVPTGVTNATLYAYSANKTQISVNVVPYINKITTALSSGSEPSVYSRTALGHYPVRENEEIKVEGFNFGSSPTFELNGTPLSGSASAVEIANAASSGKFVVKVGSIESINNLSNNTKPYNQRPNDRNNDILTDDTEIDVWQFNSEAVKPSNSKVSDLVMKINPSNSMIGFAFANGSNLFSMPNGNSNSYIQWQKNWDDYGNVDFVYSLDGNTSYAVASPRDTNYDNASKNGGHGDKGASPFTYYPSNTKSPSADDTNGGYDGSGGWRLESLGTHADNMNKNRIQSPSLAVTKNGVYLAYYDSLHDQIRFRHETQMTGDSVARAPVVTPVAKYSILAGGSTGNKAGEFVSLAAISGGGQATDVVLAVWYDGNDLLYSYKVNPANDNDADQAHNGTTQYWATPKTIFEGAGEYCKIVVDYAKGVHIVAYDGVKADLKYAYLKTYNGAFDKNTNTCTVDSYGIVGSNITLDVAISAKGNPIPYIGYYADFAAKPKLAYLLEPDSGFENTPEGVNSEEKMTGKWEISYVPTAKRTIRSRVNVGVWKNTSNGKLTNSTNTSSSSGTISGTVYGNGTSHPVLAYILKNGKGETAQKK